MKILKRGEIILIQVIKMLRFDFDRKPRPQSEKQLHTWQKNYQLLKNYADRTGTAVPPAGHKAGGLILKNWVIRQRERRRNQQLPEDQKQLLEALPGWKWGRMPDEILMPDEVEPDFGGKEWNFIISGRGYREMAVHTYLLGKGPLKRKTAIRAICKRAFGPENDPNRHPVEGGRTWFLVERALDALIRHREVDRPKKGFVRAVIRDPDQIMDDEWREIKDKIKGRSKMTREEVARRVLERARAYWGVQVEDGEVPERLMEVLEHPRKRRRSKWRRKTVSK